MSAEDLISRLRKRGVVTVTAYPNHDGFEVSVTDSDGWCDVKGHTLISALKQALKASGNDE